MWIGWIEFDLLLGDVHSLKQKRSIIRPIIADLRRTFAVAAAETSRLDKYRRAGIGASVVSSSSQHAAKVLETVEKHVASHPEFDLLSARRRIANSDDI